MNCGRFMWDYVGIVRTNKRPDARDPPHSPAAGRNRRVLPEFQGIQRPDRAAQSGAKRRPHHPLAQLRQESRGLHYSLDYPETLPIAGNTVLNPRPGTLCPSVCGLPSEATP